MHKCYCKYIGIKTVILKVSGQGNIDILNYVQNLPGGFFDPPTHWEINISRNTCKAQMSVL